MNDMADGPLDAAWVARKHTAYDELSCVDDALWWLQSDPEHGGIRRLVRSTTGEPPATVTAPTVSVGGWLHAYGGGAYAVASDRIWIVSGADSRIYQLTSATLEPELVVPPTDDFVYGDLHVAGRVLLAVRGDEEGDEIISLGPDRNSVQTLVRTDGFLAAPRLHNGHLAYLEWTTKRMPWDSSTLYVVPVGDHGPTGDRELVAGGRDESVVQPSWGPDGALYFMSDRTGWWNLYRWDGQDTHAIAAMDADCAPAPWEAGYQSYAFLPDGGVALTVHDGFRSNLVLARPDGTISPLNTQLTSIKPYLTAAGEQLAIIGSSSDSAPSIRRVSPTTGEVTPVLPKDLARPPGRSVSSPVARNTQAGERGVGYLLHLPSSAPGPFPLLVRAHPGPTDDVRLRLDWTVQFFVSRGFAVAEVAYRGSTGLGRAFRQVLDGHWGEYDVEDCAVVAEQLLKEGVAQEGAIFISGASAGGYTALKAASLPGLFAGVTATSAIVDPTLWMKTAPRFQRAHAAALRGPAGAVHAGAIGTPVLLIHGTEDDVAPVSDAVRLADSLAEANVEHEVLILEGAGHYLSAPDNLRSALEAEWAFYRRIMGDHV